MKLHKRKTARGFILMTFEDAYRVQCSLQESSSVMPHVWLGPDDAPARMHINPKMAWTLGIQLIKFAIRGHL